MKTNRLSILFLAAVLAFSSCRKTTDPEIEIKPIAPETINGEITTNKTLTADRTWILDGVVLVKSGAVLTVEPGTIVKAKIGTKAALVIDKGSKLVADGTVTKPIVFTSGKDAGSQGQGRFRHARSAYRSVSWFCSRSANLYPLNQRPPAH